MKRLLVLLSVMLMLLSLGMTANAAEGQTIGKEIKVAMDADPVSLDPHVQLSAGMLQYSHLVFDPLVRWNKKMEFESRLATKWERVSDTAMRFYLRKGVKFHSGNPFTAEDVKWTLERLKVSQDYKGLFEPFDSAKVIDDHTVDIITKKPYALLLNMATYIFPMDRKFYRGMDENGKYKDAIVKVGPSFALKNESGTGKYKVTYREQGVRTVFEKFADYWDTASPGNADKITLTPIKEDATRMAALLSGDVDFIMPVPPQDYARIEKDANVQLVTMPGSRIITFQLNQSRRPEFKDKRVRQAMVYAVNNAGIAKKIMKGTATPAGQQAPEGFAGYKANLTPRYDLEKAKALMKEAGLEKGFECTMIAPNNRYVNDEKIAEAVVGMLSKINIRVSLKAMPKAQFWDQFDAKVADIQMIGWHPDTEDSANYTEFLLMCINTETGYGQYNSGTYCNPKVDELILASQSETDLAKRRVLLQEAEQILYDDAAFIPLHWQNLSWAGKKNLEIEPIVNVQNFPYFGDLVVQ
ncbi:nickel/dipeptide/oligopeptide ABC transporter su bstrate-binding protein [Desulfonema ishimotonii]|uniref:Nickel/dipeptide/oligopeptide ABC transporter su bstrate-binding protein n=1 Tax=Desulfonema ishimotonii TaxID=45657 RepID=A0A401G1D3_9BACT|nr:ABC transporter substrate-binding protein [Desulfonema ishimotonii]GBC63029.1 nickel/dipeptide/oligopeptide ABC transporter su bstrate-binding protein [Desulfonema ishimotonii]